MSTEHRLTLAGSVGVTDAVQAEAEGPIDPQAHAIRLAEQAIRRTRQLRGELKTARVRLATLRAARADLKLDAVARLMLLDNPATAPKKYTWSDAKDFAQADKTYAAYKADVAAAEQKVDELLETIHDDDQLIQVAIAAINAEATLSLDLEPAPPAGGAA